MIDASGRLIPKVGIIVGIRFSRLVTPEWAIGLATQNYGMGVNAAFCPIHCMNPKTGSQGPPRDVAAEYIAQSAVDNDVPYVMFIDDDIELPLGAARHMMQVIAASDDDVMAVGGIYVTKQNSCEPVVFKDISLGAFWRWKKDTVFPCELMGLGCTIFKTEVFRRIEKPWFRDVDTPTMQCTDDAFFFAKMKLHGFKALADGFVLPTHWDYEAGKGYKLPDDSYPMLPLGKEHIFGNLPEGWMTVDELSWLSDKASQHERIVELGSFKGRSTVVMAKSTSGKVWAIDDWRGPRKTAVATETKWEKFSIDQTQLLNEFKENTAELKNIECVVSDHKVAKVPVQPDMVFVDGDHEYESVKLDILKWKDRLVPGGLLCGHDANWPGVKQALDELLPGWKTEVGTIWSAQ